MSQQQPSRKSVWAMLIVGILFLGIVVLWQKDAFFGEEEVVEEKAKTEETNEVEEANDTEATEEKEEVKKEEPAEEVEEEEEIVVDENGYIEGMTLPSQPTYIDGILIASKQYPLPATFNPGEDPDARHAFEEMAKDAKEAGFTITAFSTFRSYDYQVELYDRYVARDGQAAADRYSARPGYSEHQTGLAFDIGEVGNEADWASNRFGQTPAGKWVNENAHRYGFILRYPEGKEHITGYMHESWHFRYVGKEIAKEIHEKGITLEEYLGVPTPKRK